MASSVSILNNYDPTLFTFGNKDLLLQGLMMKQGTYDLNKAKIEETRKYLANFDIKKKETNDYFEGRIKATDNILKRWVENGDLGNQGLSDQLIGKLEQAVDETVLNGIVSTSIRQKEEASWAEAKKKNDGSYSDRNYAVMSKRWNDYMNDGQVSTEYGGGGGFVKFVDLPKIIASPEFNKALKEADLNVEWIESGNGYGEFTAIDKFKGIKDTGRLRAFIDAYIGEDGKKQMQIDSIYNYGYGDSEESISTLRSDFDKSLSIENERYETRLNDLNIALSGKGLDAPTRAMYQEQKKQVEKLINDNSGLSFNSMVSDRNGRVDTDKFQSVAYSLYSKNVKDDLFNIAYIEPLWQDHKLDEVQAKAVEFNWAKEKFNLEFEQKERHHDDDMMTKGYKKDGQGGYTIDAEGLANIDLVSGELVNEKEEIDPSLTMNIVRQEYKDALKSVIDSAGGYSNWSVDATNELVKKVINGDIAIGQTITVDGNKKITVTKDNLPNILRLSQASTANGGVIGELSNSYRDWLSNDKNFSWGEMSESQLNAIPNVSVKLRADGSKFVVSNEKIGGDSQGNKSNIAFIVGKLRAGKPLSIDQRKTLELYKLQAVKSQSNLGFDKGDLALMERSFLIGDKDDARVDYRSYNDNDFVKKENERNSKAFNKAIENNSYGNDKADFLLKRVVNDSFGNSIEGVVNYNGKTSFQATRSSTINKGQEVLNRYNAVVGKGDTKEEKLLHSKISLKTGVTNDGSNFYFEPVYKNNKESGEYSVYKDVKTTKGGKTTYSREKVATFNGDEMKDLENYGLLLNNKSEGSSFNTNLGAYAASQVITPNFYGTNANAKIGSREYYGKPMQDALNNLQSAINQVNGDFNIYNFLQERPSLAKGQMSLIPTSEGYVYGINSGTSSNPKIDYISPNLETSKRLTYSDVSNLYEYINTDALDLIKSEAFRVNGINY